MRFSLILASSLLVFTACKKDGTGDDTMTPDSSIPGETPAFTITSTDYTLPAGSEQTICFYFHTPNTAPIAVNKWVSDMTPGSHHMIMFLGGAPHADGIDTNNTCGVSTSSAWTYASTQVHDEEDLPADDGAGKPLAQLIQPNTQGAFQMHYVNATDGPLTVHVSLNVYALAEGKAYTQTDAFITFNNDISIAPHAVNVAFSATCNLPAGAKFWLESPHAHKQAVKMEIFDGANTVYSTTDWEHPGSKVWDATPFYTFTTGKLSWTCTYSNTGDNANNQIVAGQSAQTNEMCMANGYYFPSTGPKGCLVQGGNCFCQ